MKYLPYLIVMILTAVVMFLLMKSCSKEGDLQTTINNLKEDLKEEQLARESKEVKITELNKAIDSLAVIKNRAKVQIVYRTAQIDSAIARDSSNSLVEYRRSLQDNNYLPDGTLYLSYREIGLGAILMAKIPKLELQIKTCEQQSSIKDTIIADNEFIKKSYKESLRIQKLETLEWQKAYEDEASFWNSKELWFGIGVLVSAGIVFASGALK